MGGPGSGRANPARKQAILDAWLANRDATLEEIGKQFGVTRERVRQIVTHSEDPPRARVERRKKRTATRIRRREERALVRQIEGARKKALKKEERRQLASKLWLDGTDTNAIAKAIGLQDRFSLYQYIIRERAAGYADMFPPRRPYGHK